MTSEPAAIILVLVRVVGVVPPVRTALPAFLRVETCTDVRANQKPLFIADSWYKLGIVIRHETLPKKRCLLLVDAELRAFGLRRVPGGQIWVPRPSWSSLQMRTAYKELHS